MSCACVRAGWNGDIHITVGNPTLDDARSKVTPWLAGGTASVCGCVVILQYLTRLLNHVDSMGLTPFPIATV